MGGFSTERKVLKKAFTFSAFPLPEVLYLPLSITELAQGEEINDVK